MKWITRERPKIDRIACPWLIARFIDKEPTFLYVPNKQVLETAETTGAIPYDIPGVELTHRRRTLQFRRLPGEVPLDRSGTAATCRHRSRRRYLQAGSDAPIAGPLCAFAGTFQQLSDDHEMLEQGMVMYDALYAWCKDCQAEAHTWPLAMG